MGEEQTGRGAYVDQVVKLVVDSRGEEALVRLKAFEEAMKIADENNDEKLGFDLRMDIVKVAMDADRRDVSLVAFAWCLAYADKHLGGPNDELLWRYKWIIGGLTDFPEITAEQVDSALEDMKRRYQDAGYGLKAYHQLRLTSNLDMGRFESTPEAIKAWEGAMADKMTDCPACVVNAKVQLLAMTGRVDESMKEAEPLWAGKLSCAEVPEHTVGHLLLPLLKVGRVKDARMAAELKFRRITRERLFLLTASHVMFFMAVDDQLPRSVKLLETLSKWAVASTNPNHVFQYYVSGYGVLECLKKAGRTEVTLRLPAEAPGYDPGMVYPVERLMEVYRAKAQELADRFDRRNGNKSASGCITEVKELAGKYPLAKEEPEGENKPVVPWWRRIFGG